MESIVQTLGFRCQISLLVLHHLHWLTIVRIMVENRNWLFCQVCVCVCMCWGVNSCTSGGNFTYWKQYNKTYIIWLLTLLGADFTQKFQLNASSNSYTNGIKVSVWVIHIDSVMLNSFSLPFSHVQVARLHMQTLLHWWSS